jgi:hypothetical protein
VLPLCYPCVTFVLLLALDIYEPSGASMDGIWEAFKTQYEGKKLMTLSETGGIVVPDSVRSYKTMWRCVYGCCRYRIYSVFYACICNEQYAIIIYCAPTNTCSLRIVHCVLFIAPSWFNTWDITKYNISEADVDAGAHKYRLLLVHPCCQCIMMYNDDFPVDSVQR